MTEINLQGKKIGKNSKPFIIAEMSGNHEQSLDKALSIVEAAAIAGADAVKLQTYTPDTMTLNINRDEFLISDPNSLWHGQNLYQLYHKAHTPWEWHASIFKRCNELGLICFSTPFDASAVDFLENFNPPLYKVASFENTDLPLIRKIAATGKPMIISTGMANISELAETVHTARDAGCKQLILLKCTSTYPATPESSNLLTLPHMSKLFECEVGLSDHTLGIGVALASIALGATVIEKHFALSRNDEGVDTQFSLEPNELAMLCVEAKRAHEALGKIKYGVTEQEKSSLQFRRTIYIVRNMKAGETFNLENLRAIRPGFGLSPKYLDKFLGKKINRDVNEGTPLSWELL